MEVISKQQQAAHIVLVHGACHGAWTWFKLKPLLEEAGHRVTAIDLSAAGINPRSLHEVRTMEDYTAPLLELMEAVPPAEKVVLVGHSFGGMSLALAMEKYAHKVYVAVFLTAFMPDTAHVPSYVIDQLPQQRSTPLDWLDSEITTIGTEEEPRTSFIFGQNLIRTTIYQLCSSEDVALATMLMRPISLFTEDLSKKRPFSGDGYGSVKRVYIVCKEDKTLPESFQRWEIENAGIDEVREMENSDHMAMLCKPHELCQHLAEIAKRYA